MLYKWKNKKNRKIKILYIQSTEKSITRIKFIIKFTVGNCSLHICSRKLTFGRRHISLNIWMRFHWVNSVQIRDSGLFGTGVVDWADNQALEQGVTLDELRYPTTCLLHNNYKIIWSEVGEQVMSWLASSPTTGVDAASNWLEVVRPVNKNGHIQTLMMILAFEGDDVIPRTHGQWSTDWNRW